MKFIVLSMILLLGANSADGQGTRRLRHAFSLFKVYRDYVNISPTLYILSSTPYYIVSGVVNVPLQGYSYSFSVEPLGMTQVSLSSNAVGYDTGWKDTTITVEADGDVVVYGYSQYSGYQDSYYVIPITNAGTEYYAYSYTHYTTNPGSYLALSSFYDDTNISIYFNDDYNYNSVVYNRSNALHLPMNALATFLFEVTFDFTGTYLNSTKPFSLSCGNPYIHTDTYSSLDSLVEFPLPVNSWGSYYLVTTFKSMTRYTLRILAAFDNTVVSLQTIGQNDTRTIILDAGDFHEESQIATGAANEISSSTPVMVVQYMESYNPSMTGIPPLDKAIKGPLYFNSISSSIDITVWLSSSDTMGLILDGDTVTWETKLTDHAGWSIVQATVYSNSHTLSHQDMDVRIVAIAYKDGYAHPVMYFSQQDNDNDTLPPFIYGCPEESIVSDVDPQDGMRFVYWDPPTASDNSGLDVANETNYSPGDPFPIGSTDVIYSFEDASANSVSCVFEVIVIDGTAPLVVSCPSHLKVSTCADSMRISWEEPVAVDESSYVTIKNFSHFQGDSFTIGETTVSYVFADSGGNEVVCEFLVTVEPRTCLSTPVQGLIAAISLLCLVITILAGCIGVMIFKHLKS